MKDEDTLHEMYSSSATVHLIKRRYGVSQIELARMLGVTKVLVTKWVKAEQPIGIKSYNKIVALYPELRGRIDYGDTYYKGN